MIGFANLIIPFVARSFKYSIHVNADHAAVELELLNDHALGSSVYP